MLPPICARTGRPADCLLAVRAKARAGWTLWLLALGVLPFLVARYLAPEVTIKVPCTEQVVQQLEHFRLARLLALLGTVTLAGFGLVTGYRPAAFAAVTFLGAAALLGAVQAARSVRARFDPSARYVVLSGVHPSFRDAVDRLQQAAWSDAAGWLPLDREHYTRPAPRSGGGRRRVRTRAFRRRGCGSLHGRGDG